MFTIAKLLNLPTPAQQSEDEYAASRGEHCIEQISAQARKRSFDSVCDLDSCNESDKDSLASGKLRTQLDYTYNAITAYRTAFNHSFSLFRFSISSEEQREQRRRTKELCQRQGKEKSYHVHRLSARRA